MDIFFCSSNFRNSWFCFIHRPFNFTRQCQGNIRSSADKVGGYNYNWSQILRTIVELVMEVNVENAIKEIYPSIPDLHWYVILQKLHYGGRFTLRSNYYCNTKHLIERSLIKALTRAIFIAIGSGMHGFRQ